MNKRTIAILIAIVLLLSVSLTYAWYTWTSNNTSIALNVQGITITCDHGTNITANLIPTSNKDATGNVKKTITVKANTTVPRFNIYLDVNTLPDGLKNASFKWELYKGATLTNSGNFANAVVGNSISILKNTEITTTQDTYYLYIWIDGNMNNPNTMQEKTFDFALRADASNEPFINMAKYIEELTATNSTELYTVSHDSISANNSATGSIIPATIDYRYYGATPNNYVYYNCTDNNNPTSSTCELWRIIGAINTYTPSKSTYEYRVKIVKADSVGLMKWDNRSFSTCEGIVTVNNNNNKYSAKLLGKSNIKPMAPEQVNDGVNAWIGTCGGGTSESSLNKYLNRETYWTTILTNAAKELIEAATWYLGSYSSISINTTPIFYIAERGKTVYTGDIYTRATNWNGIVGLIYPSDYGYAAGNSCATNTSLYDYNTTCNNIDWLYNLSHSIWTITSHSNSKDGVYNGSSSGLAISYAAYSNGAYGKYAVYPTVYLSSDVIKKDGTGTSIDPYVIG